MSKYYFKCDREWILEVLQSYIKSNKAKVTKQINLKICLISNPIHIFRKN